MRALQKSKKLMCDKHNSAGVIQAEKALRALEQPRIQATQNVRENEEQALRQMVTGIIPEWQEVNDEGKGSTIEIMKLWTGDMVNLARVQMKNWMEKKNGHRAGVQRRWDNRREEGGGKEHKEEKGNIEKTYGIKHWGRVRTIPTLHKQ
eukprot:5596167-Pleurochrysis_carterae.AAC.2